jgi:NodT family efflux transporter outer membrane factor (OMF) lipoprotein
VRYFSFQKLAPVFLVVLSGCLSMSEKEKTENLSGPVSIAESVKNALASGDFEEGHFPKENWWRGFQSESLTDLIETALKQNPSLLAIESRIEVARQEARVAKSKLFPSLFFNADDNLFYLSKNSVLHLLNPDLPLHAYQVDLSLAFQYEFDFWGKYRNQFKSTLGQLKAEEAEFSEAKLILSSSLAQSYFSLLVSYNKKELYEELCSIRRKVLELQNMKMDGQLSSKIPSFKDDERLKKAEQELLDIDAQIEVERHLINILSGRSPDSPFGIDSAFLPTVSLPKELSANLLARRPDLMAQIWRVEALAHQVSAAKADFFPNINLAALGGFTSTAFSSLFNAGSQTGAILPALNLPIFTGGSIRANLRSKKALFDEAVFTYNEKVLQSVQEVADLLVYLQNTFSQKQLQNRVVEDANARFHLISLKNIGGLDSMLTPLTIKEEVIEEQLKNLSILYNEYAFTVKLIKALGGGFEEPLPLEKP